MSLRAYPGPALLLAAWLTGCAGGGGTLGSLPTEDGPPAVDAVDISEIPDAVPRAEPLARFGNPDMYEVLGKRYHVMRDASGYRERGVASWYGRKFQGRRTSSGEPYDMFKMTAAHRTLPLPSFLRVTNLENGREVIVRVNDRGPFHADRIIDLSYAAAVHLDMIGNGTAPVALELVEPGNTDTASSQAEDPALYLQVGAFSRAENARDLAARLRRYGLERVAIAPTQDAEPLHRVRIGPYNDPAALKEARRVLERHGLAVTALRD